MRVAGIESIWREGVAIGVEKRPHPEDCCKPIQPFVRWRFSRHKDIFRSTSRYEIFVSASENTMLSEFPRELKSCENGRLPLRRLRIRESEREFAHCLRHSTENAPGQSGLQARGIFRLIIQLIIQPWKLMEPLTNPMEVVEILLWSF